MVKVNPTKHQDETRSESLQCLDVVGLRLIAWKSGQCLWTQGSTGSHQCGF